MYRFLMFSHLHLPKETYFSSLPFSFDPFQVINSSWSRGQHVWLLIIRSRVRSPALPRILKYGLNACCPWIFGPKNTSRRGGVLAKGHLARVSRRWLMISVIIKWPRRLCADFLAFSLKPGKTSVRRESVEGTVRLVIASNVPFPPNEASRMICHEHF